MKLNENTKITLTIGQLKKLVKEGVDNDIPVDDEEASMCQFIEDEIRERFGLQCSCSRHNTGEAKHIEIFVERPDDNIDLEQLCRKLEKFVDDIGDDEEDGNKWGDTEFKVLDDGEAGDIFGVVWPL